MKGLKLQRIDTYCGGTAVHEVLQYTRDFFLPCVLWLVHCGSYKVLINSPTRFARRGISKIV